MGDSLDLRAIRERAKFRAAALRSEASLNAQVSKLTAALSADSIDALLSALEEVEERERRLRECVQARITTEQITADRRDAMNGLASIMPGDLPRAKVSAYEDVLAMLKESEEA